MDRRKLALQALGITREDQERIRQTAREKGVEAALKLANEILDGYGVEAIYEKEEDRWSFPSPGPRFEYVNLGDSYVPTIVYDWKARRFLWGVCWGDLVERYNVA